MKKLQHFLFTQNVEKSDAWKNVFKNVCFQTCVILHRFKQNGLQIRNQCKKLHMVAPGESHFRRKFDFLRKMLDFESYNVKNSSK